MSPRAASVNHPAAARPGRAILAPPHDRA